MSSFFDKLFRGQNTQDESKPFPQLANIEELINQTIWTGTWSNDDRQNLSKIIEGFELYLSHSERSSIFDPFFAKGCAELELGLTSQAMASFDHILKVKPDHYGALILRDTQDQKLSMLRRPMWADANTTIPLDHPSRKKKR
jgi:hypothetical protein